MQATREKVIQESELWAAIVTQPAMQRLSPEGKQLVDNVAKLGYKHARSADDYKKALLQYTFRWTQEVKQNPTSYTPGYVYNVYNMDVTKRLLQAVAAERRDCEYMKRLVPVSYVLLGAVFLSLSFVFGFAFYLGLCGGSYLIGPWTNLMLFVASVGLTVTVSVAGIEWRKLQDERRERERQSKRKRRKQG